MAKPVIKKTTSASSVSKPVDTTSAVTADKKTRNRETVLIKVTASKLRDLIGADTPIGVSRKELKVLLTKAKASDVLAEAGL